MKAQADTILGSLIRYVHERLGLSPNEISTAGFAVGIIAAIVVGAGFLFAGMFLMAVSQIIDGLDGGVARRYNLQSARGQMLEIIYDRLNELAMFLALAVIGAVPYSLVALAFVAILLVTAAEPSTDFDPGFKRFILYFGYAAGLLFSIRGFEVALHVIFWANLAAFALGTIMADYRLQKDIDAQAIRRRQAEVERGMTPLPYDPPSFLSRLFS
jgi:phosphatidylglycerophosphate synthase